MDAASEVGLVRNPQPAPEPIRLVIWDLDDTFWRGTLTEGGISYVQANHDIVIELVKRGIMSSICSKNDFASIKERLTKEGLWDYFIFPSINWESKGHRLKALVEAVQLRPETVLFIDDNALNRNEAAHFVPGLQISDETIIPDLLTSAPCRGKDDSKLSRLAQYKLLETKQAEQAEAGDNREFLRASNIRVTIEHDLEPHLDRIIELINRTNQLNFTKRRLPEDMVQARAQLKKLLGDLNKYAGLVHVEDRYGDYGFTGFYLMHSYATESRLIHFCFSCRTLGMGVESWLYDRLGQPELKVSGEVLTDLFAPRDPVDWINAGGAAISKASEKLAGRIFVRGGCSMSSTAHYLELNADEVVSEFNIMRGGLGVRLDHSVFLRYAFEGMSAAAAAAFGRLGYQPEDFRSALADDPGAFDACVLSFTADKDFATYEHPEHGTRVAFFQGGSRNNDIRKEGWSFKGDAPLTNAVNVLKDENYRFHPPSLSMFSDTLVRILSFLPTTVTLIFLLGPETYLDGGGNPAPSGAYIELNRVIRTRTAGRPNVHLVKVLDFVETPSDRIDADHFNRMVYFRFYHKIAEILRARQNGVTFPATALTVEPQPVIYLGDTHARYIKAGADRGLYPGRWVHGLIMGGATITPWANPSARLDAFAAFRQRLIGRNTDSIVVIQMGEADIGYVLWLQPAAKRDIGKQVDAAVQAYFAFVDEIHSLGFRFIVVTGATLPTLDDDEQARGLIKQRAGCTAPQRERTDATLAFNARLKLVAEDRGLVYVDVSDDVLDPATKLARRSLRNLVPTELPMRADEAAEFWARRLNPCFEFYDKAAAEARARDLADQARAARPALQVQPGMKAYT